MPCRGSPRTANFRYGSDRARGRRARSAGAGIARRIRSHSRRDHAARGRRDRGHRRDPDPLGEDGKRHRLPYGVSRRHGTRSRTTGRVPPEPADLERWVGTRSRRASGRRRCRLRRCADRRALRRIRGGSGCHLPDRVLERRLAGLPVGRRAAGADSRDCASGRTLLGGPTGGIGDSTSLPHGRFGPAQPDRRGRGRDPLGRAGASSGATAVVRALDPRRRVRDRRTPPGGPDRVDGCGRVRGFDANGHHRRAWPHLAGRPPAPSAAARGAGRFRPRRHGNHRAVLHPADRAASIRVRVTTVTASDAPNGVIPS